MGLEDCGAATVTAEVVDEEDDVDAGLKMPVPKMDPPAGREPKMLVDVVV